MAPEVSYWRRGCELTLKDTIKNEQIRKTISVGVTIPDSREAKGLRLYWHKQTYDSWDMAECTVNCD